MSEYNNYFKNHYKYKFTNKQIGTLRNWFYVQWRFIKSKINFKNNSKILEIGSGIGVFYSFLNEERLSKRYIGIELDKNAVHFANNEFNTKKFTNISIETFSGRKKFDYVFAFEVLEHLDIPKKSLSKIYSLLDKGGYFIGTTPYPFVKNIYADKTHQYVLHPENWKKLLIESGFKKIELYPMTFLPTVWRINKHFNIRIPFYFSYKHFISTCLIIAKK
jgi:2-polyprenyl-3-methyl-5-hydroxy-6-metoxy-1,4-benzoquinol methylase